MAKYTNRKIITKPRILHRAHVKKDLEKMPGDSKKAMDYCHLTIIPDMAKAREAAIIAEDAVLALIDAVMSFAIEMLQTGKRLHLVNSELAAS